MKFIKDAERGGEKKTPKINVYKTVSVPETNKKLSEKKKH